MKSSSSSAELLSNAIGQVKRLSDPTPKAFSHLKDLFIHFSRILQDTERPETCLFVPHEREAQESVMVLILDFCKELKEAKDFIFKEGESRLKMPSTNPLLNGKLLEDFMNSAETFLEANPDLGEVLRGLLESMILGLLEFIPQNITISNSPAFERIPFKKQFKTVVKDTPDNIIKWQEKFGIGDADRVADLNRYRESLETMRFDLWWSLDLTVEKPPVKLTPKIFRKIIAIVESELNIELINYDGSVKVTAARIPLECHLPHLGLFIKHLALALWINQKQRNQGKIPTQIEIRLSHYGPDLRIFAKPVSSDGLNQLLTGHISPLAGWTHFKKFFASPNGSSDSRILQQEPFNPFYILYYLGKYNGTILYPHEPGWELRTPSDPWPMQIFIPKLIS